MQNKHFFHQYLSDSLEQANRALNIGDTISYHPAIDPDDFFNIFSKLNKTYPNPSFSDNVYKYLPILMKEAAKFMDVRFFINPDFNYSDERNKLLYPLFLLSILKDKKIINDFIHYPNFNDEPKLFIYGAKINSDSYNSLYGSGASRREEESIWAAVGEAVERYSLTKYDESKFLRSSYNKLGAENAIDPTSIVAFSEEQKKHKNFDKFNFDGNSCFSWTEGYSLAKRKKIFVPAQLSYFCKYTDKEPVIRYYVTTGASADQHSIKEAIYRGICEIIERDAFMIHYLNRLSPPRIDLETIQNDEIQEILYSFRRYNLEIQLLEITTDIQVPVFLAIIFDRTGIGPAVAVGAKAGINVVEVVIKAIEEALSSRIYIRRNMTDHLEFFGPNPPQVIGREDRLLFWARQEMLDKLDFFMKGNIKNNLPAESGIENQDIDKKLNWLIGHLREKGEEAIFVDLTPDEIKELGFFVTQVIIPGLQPMHLDERFPYLGGKRLLEVPKILGYNKNYDTLNPIPHPFP